MYKHYFLTVIGALLVHKGMFYLFSLRSLTYMHNDCFEATWLVLVTS
jgi:hypothetical protein